MSNSIPWISISSSWPSRSLGPESFVGLLGTGRHWRFDPLATLAYRAGKKIEWDAKTMKIKNAPDAERFLKREYRPGWKLA